MDNDASRPAGRWVRGGGIGVALALLVILLAFAPGGLTFSSSHAATRVTLRGKVLSGRMAVASAPVALYRSVRAGAAVRLGTSSTRSDGSFTIRYLKQQRSQAVLYVIVGRGAKVRLAAVLGTASPRRAVVINERTTVAAGVALAQFIAGRNIAGPAPGPRNAALMGANLARVTTGGLSPVLQRRPNGRQTSTLRTFNSLANMLVPCVRSPRACPRLMRLARPPRGPAPVGVLDALADIARNPSHNVGRLFGLARSGPAPYEPALGRSGQPDAWILALRFYGNGRTLNGPGNSAIDAQGNVWETNNYTYSRNPKAIVCGSSLFFKFTPAGRLAPGSPYSGGGVSGSGYGITLDPDGNIWEGNFGFASPTCGDQPPHNSVSKFTPDGKPLSPDRTSSSGGGFTQGNVSWPQGTISDHKGNIWIANCGNDSLTRYADGNPDAATNLTDLGIDKPFDLALNKRGQLFVTGNGPPYGVAMLNPDGTPTSRSPIVGGGLNQPLGIAADTHGNMWVANSATVSIPCPDGSLKPTGKGSVGLIYSNGVPAPKPFRGGGVILPWGIAVDGRNNVWVANFAGKRVSELCGVDHANCPPGFHTGQPISPSSGYGFDGFVRNTSVQIDPSGNVWIANNWKQLADPNANPGGYHLVVFVGVAGPLRTPLIGPPRPLFDKKDSVRACRVTTVLRPLWEVDAACDPLPVLALTPS